MRRLRTVALTALLLVGGVFVSAPSQSAAAGRYCPPGVSYCAENAFLDFWQANGELEILGLPISQAYVDNRGLIVQIYERAIFEYHPENEAKYQVLLTLLGATRLGDRPERAAPPTSCPADGSCTLLAPTNHTLRGTFLQYWQAHGGLPVFGYPLTEEFTEVNAADGKPYTVQYFERNRFELHPESPDPRYRVLLGLLGAEALQTQREVLDRPTVQVPNYSSPLVTVGLPTTLAIPSTGVNAAVEQVGVDSQGNMATPADPWNTAWYAPGTRPGLPGNAVIAGHVDYHGIGAVVFARLASLGPGAEVFVTDDQGKRRRFVVTSVEVFPTDTAPRERIFGGTSETHLNLISCIGDFNPASRSYSDRVVVFTTWDGVKP